jgi:hypothetical protein
MLCHITCALRGLRPLSRVQARYKINCLKMLMKASFQHISNHLILHMYLENRIQN